MGTTWSLAIAGILAALISLSLFTRRSVRAVLTIDARPDEIWQVLTNPEGYVDWNPIHVSVEGRFEEGATLAVEKKNPDSSVSILAPRVERVVPNQVLRQTGGVAGLLAFDHTWRLDPVEGGTKVTQHEMYQGIGVLFLDEVWVATAYRRALIQLRDLIEAQQQSRDEVPAK